jgi:hypothetical protein
MKNSINNYCVIVIRNIHPALNDERRNKLY